jgi:hypothetical protein
MIREQDHICDPASKRDMFRTIGITEEFYDEMVERHANEDLVVKDINGSW